MEFVKTTWEQVELGAYLDECAPSHDYFWDDHLYRAEVYACVEAGEEIGFFAFNQEGPDRRMICAFHVRRERLRLAQRAYAEAVERFGINAALVYSGDEQHVCLALETMRARNGWLEMQAHNMEWTDMGRPAEIGPECFTVVPRSEYAEMDRLTENEWINEHDDPRNRFYRVRLNGETVGFGSVLAHRMDERYVDVGNYVLAAHRRKHVGRSIIKTLCDDARKHGKIPTVGCWYYNHASAATLQSAGALPVARLLRAEFDGGKG